MKTFKIILAAIGKFLHYSFAAEITIGIFGVVEFLAGHHFWALIILAWGVLLTITKLAKDHQSLDS
jgi:hypothetical protein